MGPVIMAGGAAWAVREADELEALGEEIARLVGHEHAFKHHVLTLIAEFDRSRG